MGPQNRPLDLDWLEDFVTLAKTGNFSRAAEARHIAQPAFSRHIRALEEWVGVDLVDRSSHPVELTAAGRRLLPLVEEAIAGLEAARIKARAAADDDAASLRIAITHVLALNFFPQWLGRIERELRVGRVVTMSDSFRSCVELMKQRRVQFVLCYADAAEPGPLDSGGYPCVRLGSDRLVPVSAPDPEGRPRYRPAPGGRTPLLGYGDASRLSGVLERRLAALVPEVGELDRVFEAPHAILLRQMALTGRGVAWLPETAVHDELQSGRLCACGPAHWSVPLEIRLYRQPSGLAPAAESLWTYVQG